MASFHAFADMGQLSGSQSSVESFGAKNSDDFRLTSSFNITSDVKAYAVVTGTVFIQNVNSTEDPSGELVNLIIKPFFQAKINFSPVKYFIYRGLKKADFISGGTVNTSGSEFINEIQAVQTIRNNELGTSDPVPLESLFGFDLSPLPTTLIDDFFFNSNIDSQLAMVNIGTYIGDFKSSQTIGFEIVLENPSYFPTIEMAQKLENFILGADGNSIQKRKERELILNFVDPSAYYGMHLESGLKVGNKTGVSTYNPSTDDVENEAIYDNIIRYFETRNKVYLDIRDNNGNSLNFYQNYLGEAPDTNKEIKLSLSPNSPLPMEYYNSYNWPIHILTDPSNTSVEDNIYTLSLPINENPNPLIFIEYGCFELFEKFIDEGELLQSGTNSVWTDEQNFIVPNKLAVTTSEKQISTIIKIHYIRKINNTEPISNTVVPTEKYTDSIFGPIQTTPKFDGNDPVKWTTGYHKKYIDATPKGEELVVNLRYKIVSIVLPDKIIVNEILVDTLSNGDQIVIEGSLGGVNDGTKTVSNVSLISSGLGIQTEIEISSSLSNDDITSEIQFILSKNTPVIGINSIGNVEGKRITLPEGSLKSSEVKINDTVDIINSINNDGVYTINNVEITSSSINLYVDEPMVSQNLKTSFPGFGYMAETGVALENQRIIFYATPFEYNPSVLDSQTPNPLAKNLIGGVSSYNSFFLTLQNLLPGLILEKHTIKLAPSEFVTILSYKSDYSQKVPFARSNFMALGLTLSEFNSIKLLIDNQMDDSFHDIFLTLHPSPEETEVDLNNEKYKKYELNATGLDSNGIQTNLTIPTGDEIYIYTVDELLFTSNDFGNLENLTEFKKVSSGMIFEENQRLKDGALESFNNDSSMVSLVSSFQDDIDTTSDRNIIKNLVESYGKDIYKQALDYQIQQFQSLPYVPDDRPLYWARIHMRAALRIHPVFASLPVELKKQIDELEIISRGISEVSFNPVIEVFGSTANDGIKRVQKVEMISGDTVLTVEEDLTSSVADGFISYTHYVDLLSVELGTPDKLKISGDFTAELTIGEDIAITSSSDNNNPYTILSLSFDSLNSETVLELSGNVPNSNSTNDGRLAFLRKIPIGNISTFENKIIITGEDVVKDINNSTLRVLISGFDPYQLWRAPSKYVPDPYKTHNPAGIVGLSLHNQTLKNGVVFAHIQSAGIFPVSWRYFNEGFIEDSFKPHIDTIGNIDTVVTISLDGPNDSIQIDRFFAKARGITGEGNEKRAGGVFPPLKNSDWHYETTLPFVPMIYHHVGANFNLRLDQTYRKLGVSHGGFQDSVSDPNDDPNIYTTVPPPTGQLEKGSGSNYMSNEIAYRVNRLRAIHNPDLPTGHLHIPGFEEPPVFFDESYKNVEDIMKILKNMLLYIKISRL